VVVAGKQGNIECEGTIGGNGEGNGVGLFARGDGQVGLGGRAGDGAGNPDSGIGGGVTIIECSAITCRASEADIAATGGRDPDAAGRIAEVILVVDEVGTEIKLAIFVGIDDHVITRRATQAGQAGKGYQYP